MIGCHQLTFGYPGQPRLFQGFDLSVEPGEMVALTGASGSGKSTLLYLLGLLLTPQSGQVFLGGRLVSRSGDYDRSRIRAQHVGFVFQDACLDPRMSVLDNVLEGTAFNGLRRRPLRTAAEALLHELGVTLDHRRRPGEVSGGQSQRVALARALLSGPEVVLADEPTGNLDPDSAATVLTRLRGHADDGGAVVIATHDPRVTRRCDRTIRCPAQE